ncbi:TPA: hypothetical protein ENX78_00290 [Candidatus Poribacteria bacterium]|nr:hypothetical protein [Candidatus Poribacteria bacterium]
MFTRFLFLQLFMTVVTILSIAMLFTPIAFSSQEIKCLCIADTMFSGHSSEHNTNCGARANLRVKGWQGIVVFKFDMTNLKGSKADSATLKVYCSSITGTVSSPHTLTDMKISTIAHDWIEGDGDYAVTDKASTYDYPGGELGMKWADKDYDGNGRNGVQITVEDVINGLGGSVLNSEIPEATFAVNKWTEIPIEAKVIQPLIDEKQYGIVIWQPDIGKNIDIASKENAGGQNSAVLLVRARGAYVSSLEKVVSTWAMIKYGR